MGFLGVFLFSFCAWGESHLSQNWSSIIRHSTQLPHSPVMIQGDVSSHDEVFRIEPVGEGILGCSATLLSNKTFITAAHCFPQGIAPGQTKTFQIKKNGTGETVTVQCGIHSNYLSTPGPTGPISYQVNYNNRSFVVPPAAGVTSMKNDLALCFSKEELGNKHACIESQNKVASDIALGKRIKMIGYGLSEANELVDGIQVFENGRHVQTTRGHLLTPEKKQRETFLDLDKKIDGAFVSVDYKSANGKRNGAAAGDSGGFAGLRGEDGQLKLHGVISYASNYIMVPGMLPNATSGFISLDSPSISSGIIALDTPETRNFLSEFSIQNKVEICGVEVKFPKASTNSQLSSTSTPASKPSLLGEPVGNSFIPVLDPNVVFQNPFNPPTFPLNNFDLNSFQNSQFGLGQRNPFQRDVSNKGPSINSLKKKRQPSFSTKRQLGMPSPSFDFLRKSRNLNIR